MCREPGNPIKRTVFGFSEHLQFCTESSQWLITLGSGAELFGVPHAKFRSCSWSGRNHWSTQQRARLTWNYTWARNRDEAGKACTAGKGVTFFWCSVMRLACIKSPEIHLCMLSQLVLSEVLSESIQRYCTGLSHFHSSRKSPSPARSTP